MNRIDLIGRLVAKPELRYTNSNIAYSRYTIAVNRPKQANKEQETDFIDCLVWRGQAENLVNYQDKGSLIAVEGSLRKESFDDKDGNKRYNTYVLTDRIEFLGSKPKEGNRVEQPTQQEPDPFTNTVDVYSTFGEQIDIDSNFLD